MTDPAYRTHAARARKRLGRELRPTEQSKLRRALEQAAGVTAANPEELTATERARRTGQRVERARQLEAWERSRKLP